MRPQRGNIAAPEFPGGVRWLKVERRPRMSELTAAGPVLVHFFDFAQLNSVRAMPYLVGWNDRYAGHGLTTLGVHTPRYPFSAERERLEPGLEALGVEHPVADDSRYLLWHDYGCKGWPSLFLWGQGGALRWFHFGEGEYEATEVAIQEELRMIGADGGLPDPMAPLRDTDAPGALVAPPSDELFPGGSETEPWRGDAIELDYAGGGAHASVSGTGELEVSIDGGEPRTIEVPGAGLYDLATHPRHESHRLRLTASDGVDVYSLSFSAGLPS
jgi:Thioredoxin like C-terminal domain